jgi:hypothetical protein
MGLSKAVTLKTLNQTHSIQGFSMMEAMLACALMALGLAGSVRLSMITLWAAQSVRNLDMASALAQDLGECWEVQTPLCLAQFESTASVAPFSNDPTIHWTRTWQETDISILGAPSGQLKELSIKVTWPEGDRTAELVWVKRRTSTPTWVGA